MIGPVLKYPGSKWRMADWVVSHMPKHGTVGRRWKTARRSPMVESNCS